MVTPMIRVKVVLQGGDEHDIETPTDIITFDHCVGDVVSGDLYISVDRVKENAKNLGQTVKQEMLRVCAHGVLHLCGYGDKTTEEAATMRKKEDQWLNVFHVEHP